MRPRVSPEPGPDHRPWAGSPDSCLARKEAATFRAAIRVPFPGRSVSHSLSQKWADVDGTVHSPQSVTSEFTLLCRRSTQGSQKVLKKPLCSRSCLQKGPAESPSRNPRIQGLCRGIGCSQHHQRLSTPTRPHPYGASLVSPHGPGPPSSGPCLCFDGGIGAASVPGLPIKRRGKNSIAHVPAQESVPAGETPAAALPPCREKTPTKCDITLSIKSVSQHT